MEAGKMALLADAGITVSKDGLRMAGVPLAQVAR